MEITLRRQDQAWGRPGSASLVREKTAYLPGDLAAAGRRASPTALELLPVVGRHPLTAPLGVGEDGEIVTLDLAHPGWRRMVVTGDAEQQGEALRTILAGLCLNTRPVRLQVAGVDLTGNALSALDGFPHRVSEVARAGDAATALLRWMADEARARRQEGRGWPEMVLVVHDLEQTRQAVGRSGRRSLDALWTRGAPLGIHLLIGRRSALGGGLRAGGDVAQVLAPEAGEAWTLRLGRRRSRFHLARLTAIELDQIAGRRLARTGPRRPTGRSPEGVRG